MESRDRFQVNGTDQLIDLIARLHYRLHHLRIHMQELHKDVLSTMQDVRGLKRHLNYLEEDNELAWDGWKRRRDIAESNPEVVEEGEAVVDESPKSESLSTTERYSNYNYYKETAEAQRES